MSGSKYLGWCLALTFFIVGVVGAFNYIADPFGIYHYGKSWDWIHSRPEALEASFIFKARAVEQAQADVLFLGSSRTAEGLDPHNPAVPGRAYNLGLPNSSLYEQWRYFQHAAAVHMPSTVVLGVDTGSFSAERRISSFYSDDRLMVRPDGTPTPAIVQTFADLAPTLFSLPTATLSFQTLMAQSNTRLKFDQGYEANAPSIVYRLDLTKRVYIANQKWLTEAPPAYRAADGAMPEMDDFDHLVAFCVDNHIHLIVFMHPMHSAMLDLLTKDWDVYSGWERELVARMETHPGLKGEFWDFTSYDSMSTEPFPAPTETYSHMHYYWEGSHYRKIVGDMILQRIFNGTGPAGFGRMVTNATVDQDLQRLASEKSAWHNHHQAVQINPATDQAPAAPSLFISHAAVVGVDPK